MTATLELNPEVEQQVLAQAQAAGLTVEAYLLSVIQAAASPVPGERASLEEFEAAMDQMAECLDNVPVLAPEATSRESIYGHRA